MICCSTLRCCGHSDDDDGRQEDAADDDWDGEEEPSMRSTHCQVVAKKQRSRKNPNSLITYYRPAGRWVSYRYTTF